ncbi:hypothetical protein C6A85_000000107220 [Mycobacterium sp. ITM-2017-0098]|nr:hypothetical protein C6A85_000000107220 [Mycobacterium sp. ITM-2017-0098]
MPGIRVTDGSDLQSSGLQINLNIGDNTDHCGAANGYVAVLVGKPSRPATRPSQSEGAQKPRRNRRTD